MGRAEERNTASDEPMVRALRCLDNGAAEPLEWAEATRAYQTRRERAEAGWIWLHLDRADAAACDWLHRDAGLMTEVAEALTSDDTRPRATSFDDGVLVILRGRDRKAKNARKPMVSLRLFVTPTAIVSVRLRPFQPTYSLAAQIASGDAPPTPGAFIGRLVELVMAELETTLDELDVRLEELERLAFAAPTGKLRRRRTTLMKLRSVIMEKKRYMRPQEEALKALAGLGPELMPPHEAPGLLEAADQASRIGDDLDALRESAALVNEEMQARLTDRLNQTMLRLAAVSTVFLPLTFATGLLGVNLAGIPFAEAAWAFGAFAVILALIAGAAIYAVRRLDAP